MNGKVVGIRAAAPYIRLYRREVFVIKIGGAVLADSIATDDVAEQCALLADLGIRVVIVHGGGAQASELSRRLGFEPVKVAGRRVTDDAALEAVKMAIAGQVNVDLVAALRRRGARPVGLTGLDGGMLLADRRPPRAVVVDDGVEHVVDFGHVGDIRRVDATLLDRLLDGGCLPVVACLAGDEQGRPLNVNADAVAEALAAEMKAKKLIFLTDAPGVLRDANDPSTIVPFADAEDLAGLLASGAVNGGMRLKVEACERATAAGVKRTHIIAGTMPSSLLVETFTGEGCGTMIVSEREKHTYEEERR
jgi:acetylglutamate kinase